MIENLKQMIETRIERLPVGTAIITPSSGLPAEFQADRLTTLLERMYVEHGITKRRTQLVDDIESGRCKLWIAERNGQPIGSAALIVQSDGSAEVGRAVSFEKGVGGTLMLMAAVEQLQNSGPVVAEVRVSDDFLGVPSGEATQIICFRRLGLNPQALVPAFNHGDPVRQEMFLFSSSAKIRASEPAFLPDDRSSLDLLTRTAVNLALDGFASGLETRVSRENSNPIGWTLAAETPFAVLVMDPDGSSLAGAMAKAESKSVFTLIPMSTQPKNSGILLECLNEGFVPCGFDRNPDSGGHPVLLLGKLRQGTLLAPIKIVSGLFTHQVEAAIRDINTSFREAVMLKSTVMVS